MRVVYTTSTLPRFLFADSSYRIRDTSSIVCYYPQGMARRASYASFVSGASYLSGRTSSATYHRECAYASDRRSR